MTKEIVYRQQARKTFRNGLDALANAHGQGVNWFVGVYRQAKAIAQLTNSLFFCPQVQV